MTSRLVAVMTTVVAAFAAILASSSRPAPAPPRFEIAHVLAPRALLPEPPSTFPFLRSVNPTSNPGLADSRGLCPRDMLEVEGEYCPFVEQLCLHWLDPPKAEPKLRCAEFKRTPPCKMKTEKRHFCIDRYE